MSVIPVALGICPAGMAAYCWSHIGPVAQRADHRRFGVSMVHPLCHHRSTVAHSGGGLDVGVVGEAAPSNRFNPHRRCRCNHWLGVVDHRLGVVDHRCNSVVDHRLGMVDHRCDSVVDGRLHSNRLSHLVDGLGHGHSWLGHRHCWLCHRLNIGGLLDIGGL